jgi:hypothetical protein
MFDVMDTCNIKKWLKYIATSLPQLQIIYNTTVHWGLNNNVGMTIFLLFLEWLLQVLENNEELFNISSAVLSDPKS